MLFCCLIINNFLLFFSFYFSLFLLAFTSFVTLLQKVVKLEKQQMATVRKTFWPGTTGISVVSATTVLWQTNFQSDFAKFINLTKKEKVLLPKNESFFQQDCCYLNYCSIRYFFIYCFFLALAFQWDNQSFFNLFIFLTY